MLKSLRESVKSVTTLEGFGDEEQQKVEISLGEELTEMTREQLIAFAESQTAELQKYKKSLIASVKQCKKLVKEKEALEIQVEDALTREKLAKTADKELGALEEIKRKQEEGQEALKSQLASQAEVIQRQAAQIKAVRDILENPGEKQGDLLQKIQEVVSEGGSATQVHARSEIVAPESKKRLDEEGKTVGELIQKLETLTAEKLAKEKELIEMDLELTRLKKRYEKEEKDRKKEKSRLTARNEELEGVFTENEGLRNLVAELERELAVIKKSEQALQIQVTHLKEMNVRDVSNVEKQKDREIVLLKHDIQTLEAELRMERERTRRGEHVESAQKKIAALERELDGYRQLAQGKIATEMGERLQMEDRIAELSALIGTYEERALRDAERIRELEGQYHQPGKRDVEQELSNVSQENEALKVKINKLKALLAKKKEVSEGSDSGELRESRPDSAADVSQKSSLSTNKEILSKDYEALKKKHDTLVQQFQRVKEDLLQKERDMTLFALEKEQMTEEYKRKLREKDDLLSRTLNESQNKYASLEQQFKILRERYSEEIGQKEAEIFALTTRLEQLAFSQPSVSPAEVTPLAETMGTSLPHKSDSIPSFAELLQTQAVDAGNSKDQEITFLLNQVDSLKEVIAEHEKQEEIAKSQATLLKERIQRLEANVRRETHNLEYLKNLVVKLLECDTKKAKQILPAIFTVLEFSPEEKKRIEAVWANAGTWSFF